MGNFKFKLSDMIPNAWFYKLRDMGRGKKQNTTPSKKKKKPSPPSTTTQSSKPKQQQPHHHHQCNNNNNNPRKSYYFTRDLNPSNKLHTSPKFPHPNYSPDPPRKSSSKKTRPKRRTTKRTSFSPSPKNLVTPTVSAGCSCRATLESMWTKSDSPPEPSSSYSSSPFYSSAETESPVPEFRTDHVLPIESSFDEMVSLSTLTSCSSCKLNNNNNNTKDIIIDVDKNSIETRKDDKLDEYYNNCHDYDDTFSELELPPIITKPPKFNNVVNKTELKPKPRSRILTHEKGSLKVRILKEEKEDNAPMKEQQQRNCSVKRLSVNSPGVKLRVHSPRIACRKVQSHGRKSVSSTASSSSRRSLSDSFAIVKSSFNPMKDFRESMVEMILENNIRASKDLEDLLACYLSLNSDEYHDLIIKVFKQIWFDLSEQR